MIYFLALIGLGIVAGWLSGLVGIGGGVIIVPALVFIFGFTQQQAQGTTLALLVPPIGLLAAYSYYKQGFVDFRIALLVCLGFLLGSLIGAKFALNLPTEMLRRVFAAVLLVLSLKMFFSK